MTDISNCPFSPRFPYGKWNNTSTNLKLYAPLVNACYYNNPLFIKPQMVNNNLFTNTSYQMSKKELYKYLSNHSGRRFNR